jgi:hypothetical protein
MLYIAHTEHLKLYVERTTYALFRERQLANGTFTVDCNQVYAFETSQTHVLGRGLLAR